MNLPNKLTVLRVIMVPFFVFFMLADVGGAANKWIALALFVIASLTDMLDGKIARKYHLVTNFGKFMDPLADKLLVCSAMIWPDPVREAGRGHCHRDYCEGVHYQRIPSRGVGRGHCDRGELLGQVQ